MLRFPFWLLLFVAPLAVAQTQPDSPAPKPDGLAAPAVTHDPKDGGGRAPSGTGAGPVATSPVVTITAEQWARPRSGEVVAGLPGLARLVETLDSDPSQRLVVRHASGDDGTLWAEELRSWLVALGVPAVNIELASGALEVDKLLIELRRGTPR